MCYILLNRMFEDTYFALCDCDTVIAQLVKRKSLPFMEPRVSLPCSLSWSRMMPVHTFPSWFCKIHLNIIMLFMHSCSRWPLPLRFSDHSFVHISYLSHVLYMPLSFHPSWSDCFNILWGVQIMKLLVM